MVEPSVADALEFKTLDDVLRWAKFPADTEAMYTSFLSLLGAEAADEPAPLALVSEQDWTTIVGAVRSGVAAPTIMQAAKAGLVGRALRIGFGCNLMLLIFRLPALQR